MSAALRQRAFVVEDNDQVRRLSVACLTRLGFEVTETSDARSARESFEPGVYDLLLLVFALTHGMNGLRWVIDDYVHGRGANTVLKALFGVLFVALIIMGAYVIFTFSAPPEIALRGTGL